MTFVVFMAALVLIRLGLWQVERFYERQNFNEHYLRQTLLPAVVLNSTTDEPLQQMEYRLINVTGTFDNTHSIVRINQYFESKLGYSLMTPLVLTDGTAIMVDRGWIPAEGNQQKNDWAKYYKLGMVKVQGIIRNSKVIDQKIIGSRPEFWIDFDRDQVQKIYSYPLLPVFVQELPDANQTDPPIPLIATIEITEGPHAGYALQWFTFAILLLFGYPIFLKTIESNNK